MDKDLGRPVVEINKLSIVTGSAPIKDYWVCVFPRELRRIPFSRAQLALLGSLLYVAGDLSQRGRVVVRGSEIPIYTPQYRARLLCELEGWGVVKQVGNDLWAINPRYAWGGPLKLRDRAIEEYEPDLEAELRAMRLQYSRKNDQLPTS